ncbi:hypothetical protein JCM9957A_10330 [Kineosporia succinea]
MRVTTHEPAPLAGGTLPRHQDGGAPDAALADSDKSEPAGPYWLAVYQLCPPKGYCAGASAPASE